MRQLLTNIEFSELRDRIGKKINNYLIGLDRTKKQHKQKILELCHVGKFMCSYFDDFEIVKISERPDFIISNGQLTIGLEHQVLLDQKAKEREGFYDDVFEKVEQKLIQDKNLPNFLINIVLKEDVERTSRNKSSIVETLTDIISTFVQTGELVDNDFIDHADKMRHSKKTLNANFGGYLQQVINKDLILESVRRKEQHVDLYIKNSVSTQWLILVIGSLSESSYEVDNEFDVEINTKFDKVFLYEDFHNRLFELK
jgi:hypothetical protein